VCRCTEGFAGQRCQFKKARVDPPHATSKFIIFLFVLFSQSENNRVFLSTVLYSLIAANVNISNPCRFYADPDPVLKITADPSESGAGSRVNRFFLPKTNYTLTFNAWKITFTHLYTKCTAFDTFYALIICLLPAVFSTF
jgi:hypothetical protein